MMVDNLLSIRSLMWTMLNHALKHLLELSYPHILFAIHTTVLDKHIIIDLPELLGIAFESQSLVVWIPWMCPSERGQHQF